MVKPVFIDGIHEYDNYVIIFFETLKNHVEVFGYETEINLKGFEIKKEEFDDILEIHKIFVRDNKITNVIQSERQCKICDYLGIYLIGKRIARKLTYYCAERGLLDILKYAHENGCKLYKMDCVYAMENNHMDCLKYAYENGNGCVFDNDLCCYAVKYERLNCLKYLHENGCIIDFNTCYAAASHGYLDILKYAHENGCVWTKEICLVAAENGNVDCLKYAYENDCPINIDKCKARICDAMDEHCEGENHCDIIGLNKCKEYLENI